MVNVFLGGRFIILEINGNKYNVLSSQIKFVKATNNKLKAYSILVIIDIEVNEVKGYISFYVDYFDNNDFKNFINKEYNELTTKIDTKITMIEIFDTKNFIDFINSKVMVKFGNILNNQIEMNLKIDDELIKLEYHGMLDII